MIYTYEEVLKNATEFFEHESIARIYVNKYVLRDKNNNIIENTVQDTMRRIAKEIARISNDKYQGELSEELVYNKLINFDIFLGGSNMFGIGNEHHIVSLSNCKYVDGNSYDSYGSIFRTDQELAQLMKRRCGVGHDISHLRPKDSLVANAAATSSGAVSFMNRYSNTTEEVSQNGRRGALMLSVDVCHPDIVDFIECKKDTSKVTGANISIKISDEFMKAVKDDDVFVLHYPTNIKPITKRDNNSIVIENSSDYTCTKIVTAKFIWDKIVESAWSSAEPGILFWDTIVQHFGTGYKDYIPKGTNPCGEVPLSDGEGCRLVSVNLYKGNIVHNTRIGTMILDCIVDLELEKIDKILKKIDNDPEPKYIKDVEIRLWKRIRKKCEEGRRIGLGVMGYHDYAVREGRKYVDISFISKTFETVDLTAFNTSVELAKKYGHFKDWSYEKDLQSGFIRSVIDLLTEEELEDYKTYGRRNIGLLSIAPTGSISQLAQVTGGIEPMFAPVLSRRRRATDSDEHYTTDSQGKKWVNYIYTHKPLVDKYFALTGERLPSEEKVYEFIEENSVYEENAYNLDYLKRVEVQATIQRFVDHSISSTVNVSKETTKEEVSNIYMKAWESGCKGITIYRDGSRDNILSVGNQEEVDRPKSIPCDLHEVFINGVMWTVIVGLLDSKPYEIFAFKNKGTRIKQISNGQLVKNKSGEEKSTYDLISDNVEVFDLSSHYETGDEEFTTRLLSRHLREGVDLLDIIEDAVKTSATVNDLSQVLKRILQRYVEGVSNGNKCSECQGEIIYEGGCEKCSKCGHSDKCG